MALRLFRDNDYVECSECYYTASIGDYGVARNFSHGERCGWLQSMISFADDKSIICESANGRTVYWQQQVVVVESATTVAQRLVAEQAGDINRCVECDRPWHPSAICYDCRERVKEYLFKTYYRGPGTWCVEDRKIEDPPLKTGHPPRSPCPLCATEMEPSATGGLCCKSRACWKVRNCATLYAAPAEQVHAALVGSSGAVLDENDIYTAKIVSHGPANLKMPVKITRDAELNGWLHLPGNEWSLVALEPKLVTCSWCARSWDVRTTGISLDVHMLCCPTRLAESKRGKVACTCGSDACGSPNHSDWCSKYVRSKA